MIKIDSQACQTNNDNVFLKYHFSLNLWLIYVFHFKFKELKFELTEIAKIFLNFYNFDYQNKLLC